MTNNNNNKRALDTTDDNGTEPGARRRKVTTMVVEEMEKLEILPVELLRVVDEYQPTCWRSLTAAFVEQLTRDYLSAWEPTREDYSVFDVPALAVSAHDNLEFTIDSIANTHTQGELQQFYSLHATGQSVESDEYQKFCMDWQWTMFWTHYPIFLNMDRMFDSYAKDHLNGDCVDSEEYNRNVEYTWRIVAYAFNLRNPNDP